jgi:membrane-associated phospholipid phosphatase
VTSAALCALFVVVYGACNGLTALRGDVGSLYFEWERRIPFLAAFILPYMSIDLFFIGAPFLCASEPELRTFTRRIVACILIAAACFLLFPLKFTFERPYVEGWLGLVFNNFRKMDLPYNEFPSLHIALRTILAGVYYRHTKGALRMAAQVWFSLIGFSTLFTYQHHVIDILGGFVLGCVCLCLFQEGQTAWKPLNKRIGGYYLAGTAGLVAAAFATRPAGIVLLWPAASLGVAAAAYFGAGITIYRKRDGRPDFWAWVALWPLMLGQYLSLRFYATRSDPWNKLADRVWIGRRLSETEARRAVGLGVTAVVDLTCEFAEAPAFRELPCLCMPVLDLTAPTAEQLKKAAAFIEAHRREGIVYIHCKAGYSRTASVAGAWLLETGRARTAEEVVALLTEARPGIVVRPEVRTMLEVYAAAEHARVRELVAG